MASAQDPAVTRRLAAILIADVVGYTRLMERDDTGTFSRLRTIRDEVVDPAIVSHGGRIVKTAGDGLLAEFSSALSALRAAVQVQREMAARNADVPRDDCIEYRIGINLGDVLVDGSDLAGDGINVASRLETLCEPGGICVSGSVREQVHGTVDVGFEDIGEQQVKNIARPIRAWRVAINGLDANEPHLRRSKPIPRRVWLWAGAILVVIVAAVAAVEIWMPSHTAVHAAAAPPMSIAVLPFKVTGEGAVDAGLAERLTQDVITAVTRGRRGARTTPYALIAAYKGDQVDPRVVGRALDVRYVAEGDVRITQGGVATLTTRLYDATTAAQLSTATTQVAEATAGARDDMLVSRGRGQITSALRTAEQARARTSPGNEAADLLAHADALLWSENYSLSATHEALKLVDEVLKRDPNDVAALIDRFWILNNEYEEDLHADRDRVVREMDQATARAVAVNPSSADAWHARAITYSWQGRWGEAEAALVEAQRLDPANPNFVEQRAHPLFLTGGQSEISALVDEVVKRKGTPSEREERDLCWANLALRVYAIAISACEKAAAFSGWWLDEAFLTAAYAQEGQVERAGEAAARLVKLQPDITIDLMRKRRYSSHPDYRRWEEGELFAGLRKAGIPEK